MIDLRNVSPAKLSYLKTLYDFAIAIGSIQKEYNAWAYLFFTETDTTLEYSLFELKQTLEKDAYYNLIFQIHYDRDRVLKQIVIWGDQTSDPYRDNQLNYGATSRATLSYVITALQLVEERVQAQDDKHLKKI